MKVFFAGHGGAIRQEETWIVRNGVKRLLSYADSGRAIVMAVHRDQGRTEVADRARKLGTGWRAKARAIKEA